MKTKISETAGKLSQAGDRRAVVYEIPVVIHVVEPANGSNLNITDEEINRQIAILNEDFRRTNADASNTPGVFLPVAADVEVQFVLAKQDPVGNPTNGIVRIRGSRDSYSAMNHQKLLRSESYWPPQNYLNIHVLDLVFFLGYASFPVSDLPGINNGTSEYIWDGVMIDHLYFGENPSAPSFASFGRTATHEVGHYLGLRHIWGDGGCSIDDFVDDTPVADDNNGGLSSPCTFPANDSNICETDEMFQNYMDYTDDTCMNLFTEGQKTRIRTVLENSPRRLSLISSPGLTDPSKVPDDLAITQILSPQPNECSALITPSVRISNYGSTVISSYDISLSNSSTVLQTINHTTSLGISESEVVNFSQETISSVPENMIFTVTNVNGNTDGNQSDNSAEVDLSEISTGTLPFAENFEGTINLIGKNGSSFPWEVVDAPRVSPANKAIRFGAFQNTTAFGNEIILKTPVFDLTGLNSAELKFSYAYAHVMGEFHDGLTLKVSKDCGATFSDNLLFNSYGPTLATTTSVSTPFTPSGPVDWVDTTITITHIIQEGDINEVQFAFFGQNGSTNNIYLDDISIVQTEINALDVSLTSVDAPLTTCRESASPTFNIRNIGFQEVTQLSYQYTSDGNTTMETVSNLSLAAGEFQKIQLNVPLNSGQNAIDFSITAVNSTIDEDQTNNSVSTSINKNDFEDTYPLVVDFESSNLWQTVSVGTSQLWETTNIGSNTVLSANAFSQTQTGSQSWFISPALNVGSLDSAGLSFKASYASRTGFNDQLRVLMSINCGESYSFELVNADSDSLAVTQSTVSWAPDSEDDWKEFRIDLKSSIVWKNDIKIAFVFTNGNGNNLYIDDINIGIKPEPEASITNDFTVFPNPAHSTFNIAFNLSERDDVQVQLIDVSGKVIFTRKYENVLDQVYDFETVSQDGFYFVKITGSVINKTERLYIRR